MNNYRFGADFERLIAEMLGTIGYCCIRSAGSHGLVDVVAIRQVVEAPTLFVQCKRTRSLKKQRSTTRLMDGLEAAALIQLADQCRAIPILAERRPVGIQMIDLRTGKEWTNGDDHRGPSSRGDGAGADPGPASARANAPGPDRLSAV